MARAFLKHKVFGTVHAVEFDGSGSVLLSALMTEATACRHQLDQYDLNGDEVETINQHRRDWDGFDPQCSDATHLLRDIGAAEAECEAAEAAYLKAHTKAKGLKEAWDGKQLELRKMVKDATSPRPMPLFDQASA